MCKKDKSLLELLESASERLDESFSIREKKRVVRELVMEFSSLSNQDIMLARETVIDCEVVDKVNASIDRINNGEPFQYVLGKTFFYDQEFRVDSRALIPRPETEELVHEIIQLNKISNAANWNVLDVGTGTGCIAISLKLALPNCSVTGIDVSAKAIELAKENALELRAEIKLMVKDVFALDQYDTKYDVIVSNPPYIPMSEKSSMKSHVIEKEPEIALFVDDDQPIIFYKKIADLGQDMLKKRGYLAFEVHENLAEDVKNYLFLKGYENISIRQDLQGKDRMVFAQFVNS